MPPLPAHRSLPARQPWRRLRVGLIALAVTALAAVVGPASTVAGGGAEPTDRLPDLRMLAPDHFHVCGAPTTGTFQTENCPDPAPGDRWLRFDSVILNVGQGTFRLRASRPSVEVPTMSTVQKIRQLDSSLRSVPTDATLAWAEDEDGHPHWHTQGIERYRLFKLPTRFANGAKAGVKRGFCFFDGIRLRPDLENARRYPLYSFFDCGMPSESQEALSLRVGLSVGWGDTYPWDYAGQRIDISDVPDGEYLLCLTADPLGQVLERREGNNEAWARTELVSAQGAGGYTVEVVVLARGTTPCRGQVPYQIKKLNPPAA